MSSFLLFLAPGCLIYFAAGWIVGQIARRISSAFSMTLFHFLLPLTIIPCFGHYAYVYHIVQGTDYASHSVELQSVMNRALDAFSGQAFLVPVLVLAAAVAIARLWTLAATFVPLSAAAAYYNIAFGTLTKVLFPPNSDGPAVDTRLDHMRNVWLVGVSILYTCGLIGFYVGMTYPISVPFGNSRKSVVGAVEPSACMPKDSAPTAPTDDGSVTT